MNEYRKNPKPVIVGVWLVKKQFSRHSSILIIPPSVVDKVSRTCANTAINVVPNDQRGAEKHKTNEKESSSENV